MTKRAGERRALIIGALTAATVVGAGYLTTVIDKGLPTADHTLVKAAFSDIGSLLPGNEVRQNSSRIGRVDEVTLSAGQAVVTLRLDGDRPVYRNAHAAITDTSALANKFVELLPGDPSSGELGDAVLPTTSTESSVDLDQVLNTFDERTRKAAGATLREVGGGMAGKQQELHDLIGTAPDLLTDLGTVSETLAGDRANFTGLLNRAEVLTGRFTGRERDLAELIENMDTTLAALAVDGGAPLRETLRKAPTALRDTRAALAALDTPLADTGAAMNSLRDGAQALGQSTPDLRAFLRDGVAPMRKVPGVADRAVPAVEDLTHTIADARPLVPAAARAFRGASVPLRILAPYAPEIGDWAEYLRSALSDSAGADFHWLRVGVELPNLLAPVGAVEDPTLHRNPYPAPGDAQRDRAGSLTSGGGR